MSRERRRRIIVSIVHSRNNFISELIQDRSSNKQELSNFSLKSASEFESEEYGSELSYSDESSHEIKMNGGMAPITGRQSNPPQIA